MKPPFKSFGSVIKCVRFYWPSFKVLDKRVDVNSAICRITFNKEFDPLKKAFLFKVFANRLYDFLFEFSYLTKCESLLIVYLKY